MLALSIRQPFAEQILRGTKKIEYRSIPTRIRGRIYIYASKKDRKDEYKKMGEEPGTFPTGVLVGTVEIISCHKKQGKYHWQLACPKRAKKKIKPKKQPQPVWFRPF